MFDYPAEPHRRRHGPAGYTDYGSYKPWLRDEFSYRCVFCLARETWSPTGQNVFSVEHVVPKSKDAGRVCDYSNLTYACVACNSLKGTAHLLDPCAVGFGLSLTVNPDGTITPSGEDAAHVVAVLRLNSAETVEWRAERLAAARVLAAAPDSPDKEVVLRRLRGFPLVLPDLASARPPLNTRPEGVQECAFERQRAGRLPTAY